MAPARLPTFEDRERLPYLEGCYGEVMRWNLASPLGAPVPPVQVIWAASSFCAPHSTGIPHKSLEDDVYKGMFIPKGSIVFANARYVRFRSRARRSPVIHLILVHA